MLPYIIRRLIHLIPTFIGATLLAFLISQLVPGDFFNAMALQPNVEPQTIERLRAQFGLEDPWYVQYFKWMWSLLHFDLGLSFSSNQAVTNIILPRMGNSLILVGLSLVMLYSVAIPMGIYSAVRQYSLGDQIVSIFAYFGLAIPNFFFALVLVLCLFLLRTFTNNAFGYGELILPVAGMTSTNFPELSAWGKFINIMWHALLPAFVVATSFMAGFTRVLRGQMLEHLQSDYIRTARAKGLSDTKVNYKHALRLSLIPFIAGVGGLLPTLVGGAGLVEVVMSWPGITPALLEAITRQDIYVVLGLVVLTSMLLMLGNLLSDLLLAAVDPRIRYS